jgi:glycosyltransferase involved in cell wall biosynthesis
MNSKTLALVTDAWWPQVNGVVNTLMHTRAALAERGYQVTMLTPQDHPTLPCPSYPEIRLALRPAPRLHAHLDALQPDHIHVATEGPLGLAARSWCLRRGRAFTSSYHTQFPEYIRKRLPVPLAVSYAFVRRFHNAAARTMVATSSQEAVLKRWRFRNIVRWTRGVDTNLFSPEDRAPLDVLSLDLPGTKCIIGDGPALKAMRERFPQVLFRGYKFGKELARLLAAADVFVFPSRTDTFGLVMLEALACGVPVAAFPVTGPLDVIENGVTGILSEDLHGAALAALRLDRTRCRAEALKHTWAESSRQFSDNLVPAA